MTETRPGGRRHDLDALRVMSFGTLIIYHTSLIYGTKPWLLNAAEGSRLIDLISIGSHPWRMSLLFFISGLITTSLLKRKSIAQLRSERTRQLLLPFVLGILFVVPPQMYFSNPDAFSEVSYLEFCMLYLVSGAPLGHMWFLAYLWIYAFLWLLVLPSISRYLPKISTCFASSLQGAYLYLIPILFLAAIRLFLYPIFGETLIIATDIYSHVLYFSMFAAGALLMDEPRFWQEIDRQRWRSLGLSAISLLIITTIVVSVPREQWPDAIVTSMRILRSIFQWGSIIALLAFAARIANKPNRVVTYLNKSVLTYYVVHQTVIVIIGYYVAQAGMLNMHSFLPIAVAVTATCLVIGELQKFTMRYLKAMATKIATSLRIGAKPSSSGATS